MKFFIKILKIFFDILIFLCILLVILVMYNFIQIKAFDKEYPEIFGYTFFEVTTGSMRDAININDVIIVKITKDIKENDIISYFYDDRDIITHRVVEIHENEIITQGDANNSVDKPISNDAIIGKVENIIPKLGIWIKVFLDLRVIISIAITVLLFGFALTNKKGNNKKNRHSFSKFIKNVKGNIENAKETKTKD